jgi:hypothetical protein
VEHPGFWQSLVRDLTGHGIFGGSFQWRLILQPLAAIILGVRLGIRDAKQGERPFFASLFHEPKRAKRLATEARQAALPLAIAFIVDSILQHLINHHIRPLQALFVGGLLVFLPFLIVRGLTNRLWAHGHAGPGHAAKPSR